MKKLLRVLLLGLALIAARDAAIAQTATGFSATVSTVGTSQINLQGTVSGGNVLTFGTHLSGCSGCSAPANGTLSDFNSSSGTVLYTPNSGFTGSDSFTFTAISTPSGGGSSTSSSQATVTITVTNARTTISDALANPDGSARTGKVTFVLTQAVNSPVGIIPASATVTSDLTAGAFTVSLYPTTSLSPRAYYQVWWQSATTGARELIGVYDIPASTATIKLSPYKVTDTNLAARYSFVDLAGFQAFQTRSFAIQVLKGGTSIGTRGALNLIDGSNVSISCVDNSGSGRVDCTINGPAGGGTGGSVNSGTGGRLPIYASTGTTLSELAIGGANKVLGVNSSNNNHEYKTMTAGTGISITHGTGAITIANSGIISINGSSTATQSILMGGPLCGTGPGISSALGTTTICIPIATINSSGYISNSIQTIGGEKTFTGVNGTDIPLIVQDASSGSTILQQWKDSSGTIYGSFQVPSAGVAGLYANKLAAGNAVSAPANGYILNISDSQTADGKSGALINAGTSANSTTGNLRGLFLTYTMSGSGTHAPSANRSAALDANFTFASSGTITSIHGVRSQITQSDTGTMTAGRAFYSTGDFSGGGTVTNFTHYYAAAPTVGTVTFTNQYGLYIESLTGATNNWAIYGAGTTGSSLGGFLDLRGRTAPSVSAGGETRLYTDSSNGQLRASVNGGNFGQIPVFLSGSATLDFGSTASASSSDLTISVSGATVGKPVFLGIPASPSTGSHYTAWVSASGTVTVRFSNYSGGSIDPASGTFNVLVQQ